MPDLDPDQVAAMLRDAMARSQTPAVPDSPEDLLGRIVRLQRAELERVKDENQRLRNALQEADRRAEAWDAAADQFDGPYATWWILASEPAQSDGYRTGGVTMAGTGPLPEKLARVAALRIERPELGGWRMERCESWTRRVPEGDVPGVLAEWYPGLDAEAIARMTEDLDRPGVVFDHCPCCSHRYGGDHVRGQACPCDVPPPT